MALYPPAAVRLLPENDTQPHITPTQVILHTAVDGANTTSLFDWFNTGSNLEAHLYVQRSGGVEQYVDTNVQADANNLANSRAVSIETWDGRVGGAPPNLWNAEQVAAIVELVDWLCDTHGIPRRLCPTWDQPGIGWHNLFPEWSPGATGCPGPPRAGQVRDEIIPALNRIPLPAPPEEDLMFRYKIATHEGLGQLWLLWGTGDTPIYKKYLRDANEVGIALTIYGAQDIGKQGALIDFIPATEEVPDQPTTVDVVELAAALAGKISGDPQSVADELAKRLSN